MDNNVNDPLTRTIIGLAMKVHRTLGAGFLETVYRRALLFELRRAGVRAEDEERIRVVYEGASVGEFIADILVEGRVVLELKAVEVLTKVHEIQTVNYLTATGLELGLLINFGAPQLQFKRKQGRNRAILSDAVRGVSSAESVPPNPINPSSLLPLIP